MCAIRLQDLPSVDALLRTHAAAELIAAYGRPLVLSAIRRTLETVRTQRDTLQEMPSRDALLWQVSDCLDAWTRPTLFPVINATGVIVHTNLGRAPLSQDALRTMQVVAQGYSNLEYDIERGKRGSRLVHADALLHQLTGAESALVVNNNAAAVLLALAGLARRRKVIIARSQLVEIGGGFRVPEVMKQSGARLLEVGTTNRVHLNDYRAALQDSSAALVFVAHRSNFDIVGYTTEPALADIAKLAHEAGLPLVCDLGSGTLVDTAPFGLRHEPTIQETLRAGADVVTFSGDKLLGGPQAGILVGRGALLAKLKRHPLARALRADKLALAALSATLLHYLKNEALAKVPVWQMIALPEEMLRARVETWIAALGRGQALAGVSTVGGGSLPGETLPTTLLALDVPHPNAFLRALRQCKPPIVARIQDERVVFDPRTVLAEQDGAFLVGLQNALRGDG
ncbi:MAG: L-seryl-tRNA(Sec) selenium transferase [Anaerolineales bacterium]